MILQKTSRKDQYFLSLRISEIHLFFNSQLFYWHFLEFLWLLIFLVFYKSLANYQSLDSWFFVYNLLMFQEERFKQERNQQLVVFSWELYTKHMIGKATEKGYRKCGISIGFEVSDTIITNHLNDAQCL